MVADNAAEVGSATRFGLDLDPRIEFFPAHVCPAARLPRVGELRREDGAVLLPFCFGEAHKAMDG